MWDTFINEQGDIMNKKNYQVENLAITFSNLDKIYWPEMSLSKADLLNYYYLVGEYLLPHLKDRPIVMQRFPDGIKGKTFYQKESPAYAPKWLKTKKIKSSSSKRKAINYIICNDLPTLLWLANQGCIEMHPWLSKIDQLDKPEAVIFDLDPNEEASFKDVVDVALLVREVLKKLGLKSYPKTSGATGLHIYIPIFQDYSFERVRVFAEKIAKLIVQAFPNKSTIERQVKQRGSKVYIDYMQNVQGKTIASVFSVRPVPEASVSMPVTWASLERGSVNPKDFTLLNTPTLLSNGHPNFSEVLANKQKLVDV